MGLVTGAPQGGVTGLIAAALGRPKSQGAGRGDSSGQYGLDGLVHPVCRQAEWSSSRCAPSAT